MSAILSTEPRSPSGRALLAGALGGLLAVVLVGCRQATPIPDGAQVVHVVVSEAEVTLTPDTVPAGDVYLVLDAPLEGAFRFVERQRAGETPGPLSDDDLDRLGRGDTEGTATGGLTTGGCDAGQNAEDRGKVGPCGNVMVVVLREGRYAIVGDAAEGDPEGRLPPLAVLTVVR